MERFNNPLMLLFLNDIIVIQILDKKFNLCLIGSSKQRAYGQIKNIRKVSTESKA